ncbi:MAG TPA: lysophospholipid acyltransferase family protein [Gammaproteobacteria bacterium]|nr:lysophospholipid acyltransferase family protein [Gammaproteobacteria bacterium]
MTADRGQQEVRQSAGVGVWVRSVLYFLVMVASVAVFAPLAVLTFFLPFRRRYGFITQWARFNLWALARICGLHYRVRGGEHIPPGNGIVLCKHQSAWETLALQRIFPPQVWVLKRELLWIPLFGWGLAMLKPIALDRKAGRKAVGQLVRQGRSRLEEGLWVVVFPEGTRVAPGQRGRYRLGGAVLAEQTGYPVVPVAHNAGQFWPRRSLIKYPGTVDVVVGAPIRPEGRTAAELMEEAAEWIEARMAEITSLPPSGE